MPASCVPYLARGAGRSLPRVGGSPLYACAVRVMGTTVGGSPPQISVNHSLTTSGGGRRCPRPRSISSSSASSSRNGTPRQPLRRPHRCPPSGIPQRATSTCPRTAPQHGQTAPLAVPQLGFCASSGRAWQLWLARRSHGRDRPTGRPAAASGARASRLLSRRFPRL